MKAGAVRDSAELPHPAFQRLGPGNRPLLRRDECAGRSSTCTAISSSWSARATISATASDGEPDYFANKGEQKGPCSTPTSSPTRSTCADQREGARRRRRHIRFSMARGSMNRHISQFPVAPYKKAHAHGPGACVIMSGEGYTLMWGGARDAAAPRVARGIDDRPAEHVVPHAFQYRHDTRPYLAFKHEVVSIRNAQGVPKAWISSDAAAIRSTTPTSSPRCARGSRKRSRGTASSREWTTRTPPNSRICQRKPARAASLHRSILDMRADRLLASMSFRFADRCSV